MKNIFNKSFIVQSLISGVFIFGGFATANAQTPSSDLTVGSSGSQVVSLQIWLENNGYLVMPSGVSNGYFGQLTKNALIKYQISQGIIPAVGYFGSITRGHMNSVSSSNQPTISITPTSGPVGTSVTVSVTNSVPVKGGTIYFGGNAVQVSGNSVNGTQFTFNVPQKTYSGCPAMPSQANLAYGCDPALISLQPGAYPVYVEMDSTTTNSLGTIVSGPSTISNKVSFTVTN